MSDIALQGNLPQWEYRVVHIDATSSSPPTPPDPERASEKLGGVLSPDFIRREFPEQYGVESDTPSTRGTHPAQQLEYFLNLLGKQGWELANTAQVEHLLMFIFKRPLRQLPKLLPSKGLPPQEDP